MEYRVQKTKLIELGQQIFEKAGVSREDAKLISTALVTNDLRGVYSHGSTFIYGYARLLREGGAKADAAFTWEGEGAAKKADAHGSLGVISAVKAMQLAMETAAQYGVGIVTVKNSTHAAALGYYATLAAEVGMVGLAMSGGDPIMSIPGTKGRVMGNNPFAYAAPLDGERMVFFDVSMSVISGGKVKTFVEAGKRLPENWMIDKEGNPTTDPSLITQGATLLPFALHKGYGFAVMVEILAAVLSGAGIIRDNTDWMAHPEARNNIGHCMIAIDIKRYMALETFYSRMIKMEEDLKNVPAVGDNAILLPGEIEMDRQALQQAYITLGSSVYDNIQRAAREWGLADRMDIFQELR